MFMLIILSPGELIFTILFWTKLLVLSVVFGVRRGYWLLLLSFELRLEEAV